MTAAPARDFYDIRLAGLDDRPLVVDAMLRTFRPAGVAWREWERVKLPETYRLLAEGQTLVADAGAVLVGFVVTLGEVIEQLYVKPAYRGLGVGLALLGAAFQNHWAPMLQVRQATKSWRRWAAHHAIEWVTA